MYTIETDKWSTDGSIAAWYPNGVLWNTESAADAVRQVVYFRLSYPHSVFVLLKDGYIVSTQELSEMARFIIL